MSAYTTSRTPGIPCTLATAAALLLICSLSPSAMARRKSRPFEQGSMRLALQAGTTRYDGGTYVAIGAGFGYFALDGLELALSATHWFGGDPAISRISPQVRYVLHVVPVISPYVGAFYNHWFVHGSDDQDTVGGRGGIFYVSGQHFYLGAGLAYEQVVSECTRTCSVTYPELTVYMLF